MKKHLLASKCAYSSFHHLGVWIVYSSIFLGHRGEKNIMLTQRSMMYEEHKITFKTAELIEILSIDRGRCMNSICKDAKEPLSKVCNNHDFLTPLEMTHELLH